MLPALLFSTAPFLLSWWLSACTSAPAGSCNRRLGTLEAKSLHPLCGTWDEHPGSCFSKPEDCEFFRPKEVSGERSPNSRLIFSYAFFSPKWFQWQPVRVPQCERISHLSFLTYESENDAVRQFEKLLNKTFNHVH